MGKTESMDEALDEILFGKKPKKKSRKPLEERETRVDDIFEQDEVKKKRSNKKGEEDQSDEEDENAEDDDLTDDADETPEDVVLEASIRINDNKANVRITEEQYEGRAITDFVSLISLFRKSKNLKVKQFLNQLTNPAVGAGAAGAAPDQPEQQPGPEAGENPAGLETPQEGGEEGAEEGFQLSSFSLRAFERVSQDENMDVSIAGEENVNQMMSFKVSIGEDSTAFNTPESALSHFNRVFFDNIIKTIDKELEKRNE